MSYDSKADTLEHIRRVNELLGQAAIELIRRGHRHDRSKLEAPEKQLFDIHTPKLASMTYGSEQYKQALTDLKPALDHNYANNSHHPEHYKNGVNGMCLYDLIEMFLDWKAASERHEDGNIFDSINKNKKRFNLSDQLVQILKNTAKDLMVSEAFDDQARYYEQIKAGNDQLLESLGLTMDMINPLLEDVTEVGQMEVVDKAQGQRQNFFCKFSHVFVDQWVEGESGDSFSGDIYAFLEPKKWLKIGFSIY